MPESAKKTYFAASTRDLFRQSEIVRCDVCSIPLAPLHDADDAQVAQVDRYAIRGSGMYVWYRGSERRVEERSLCPQCGTAVGLKALQRWEIEEEEG
jgi:hypothetical protein